MSSIADITLDELFDEFDFLGDWEARCDYLIDLGFELPRLPESEKFEQNRVHGCQSNVWLVASLNEETDPPRIEILANSDAMIVNGLIVVVMAIYNKKSPEEILGIDVQTIFQKLELDRYLSPARKNGLAGMVQRIKQFAIQVAADDHANRIGN